MKLVYPGSVVSTLSDISLRTAFGIFFALKMNKMNNSDRNRN